MPIAAMDAKYTVPPAAIATASMNTGGRHAKRFTSRIAAVMNTEPASIFITGTASLRIPSAPFRRRAASARSTTPHPEQNTVEAASPT